MDLASSEGGLEMENNQYYDILTNAMSGDMLVVPMAYGSHFPFTTDAHLLSNIEKLSTWLTLQFKFPFGAVCVSTVRT